MRARFNADVISALRGRVISHNSAVGEGARTRLQELKKIYAGGYRGASPEENAMKAVDRHLDLRKVGDDFDESKHRRDSDGKFAPKGGGKAAKYGQNRNFADVNTQRRHESLKSRNAGYQAFQTDVIPETRYSAYLPTALAAGTAGATALAWALPEQRDELYRLAQRGLVPAARLTGQIAGRLTGATGVALTRGGQKLAGKTPISDKKALRISEAFAERGGKILGGATDKAMTVYQDVTSAANHALVNAARGPVPQGKNFAAARRRFRAEIRGRGVGAVGGALVSIPTAYGAYKLGQFVGPMVDAWAPRRVEKIDSPEINEILAKVAGGAGEEELLKAVNFAQRTANQASKFGRDRLSSIRALMRSSRGPSAGRARAMMSGVPAPQAPDMKGAAGVVREYASELYEAAGKIGRGAADRVVRRAGSLVGRQAFGNASLVTGTLGGAAAGAGAGYGAMRAVQGNPYRDEEGKFTSKEKAAFIVGGAAAGGLAAYAAMRRGNSQAAQELYERLGNKTSMPKSKTGSRALADAVSGDTGSGVFRFKGKDATGNTTHNAGTTGFQQRMGDRIEEMTDKVARAERSAISSYIKRKLGFEDEITNKIERSLQTHLRDYIKSEDFLGLDNIDGATKKRIVDLANKAKGITGNEPELSGLGKKQKAELGRLRGIADSAKKNVAERFNSIRNQPSIIQDKITKNNKKIMDIEAQAAEYRDMVRDKKISVKEADDFIKALDAQKKPLQEASGKLNDELNTAQNVADNLKPKSYEDIIGGKAAGETVSQRVEGYIKNIRTVLGNNVSVPDPFKPGKKISAGADGESVKADIEDIIRSHTTKFKELVNTANIASANHAVNLLDVAREGFKPIAMPVVSKDVDAFARKIGGQAASYIDQARADITRGANAMMRSAGFGAGNLRAKIDSAYDAGKRYATSAKEWIKDNGVYYGKLGLIGGSAVGVLDYGADGRVRWLGIDKAKVPEITPYIDLANVGSQGKEVATYGISAVTGRDGTERFLIADQERGRGKGFDYEGSVPMGAKVKDVEAAARNQGDNKGGGKPNSISNDEWNKVQKVFNKIGKDYRNIGGLQYTTRNDIGEEQGIIKRGLRKDAQQAQNFGEKLSIVTRGGGSKILTLNQRAELLVGTRDHPGGIFGRDAFEAYDEGKFGVLAGIVKNKAGDGVRGDLLKDSLRVLGRAKGQNDDLPAFREAFDYIDGVRGSSPGSSPSSGGSFSSGGKKWWEGVSNPTWVPSRSAWEPISREYLDTFTTGKDAHNTPGATSGEKAANFEAISKSMLRALYDRAVIEFERNPNETDELFHQNRWAHSVKATRRALNQMKQGRFVDFDEAWNNYTAKNASDAADDLLKSASSIASNLLKFDESKIKRQGKGSDKGGEFAPKGGGTAPASSAGMPQAAPKVASQENFWEPRRLGQTLGSGIGMQVAFDIADRHLPNAGTGKMMAVRMAAKLASALVGGYFGGKAGDTIGAASYLARGKGAQAPDRWEEPERPLGEMGARFAGNIAGNIAGFAAGGGLGLVGRAAAGALAGIGAEEMAASAYNHVSSRYGGDTAARVSRWL